MDPPTHILDPDGEVIIVLLNANAPFAHPIEDVSAGMLPNAFPVFHFGVHSPPEMIENPQPHFNQPALTKKQQRKLRKMKNKEPGSTQITLVHVPMPNSQSTADTSAFDGPPLEAPAADTPASDDLPLEAPAAESLVNSCLRIQVSAKHLIFVSSVFKKMLSGTWKESIAFLQKGLVEVTAESWDLEAFLILLRAVHGQHYHIPQKLTLETLAKVAVIADYYQCKQALYIMTDIWVRNLEETVPTTVCRDLVLWLWVSWFFRLSSQFKASTSVAISRSNSSISSWGLPIPANVISSINISRQRATDSLINFLCETRGAFLAGTRGCGFECRSIMYGALTMQMQSKNLLSPKPVTPFLNLNYDDLAQTILAFQSPRWCSPSSIYSSYSYASPHNCSDASFKSVFATLEDPLDGLDLEILTPS